MHLLSHISTLELDANLYASVVTGTRTFRSVTSINDNTENDPDNDLDITVHCKMLEITNTSTMFGRV